MAHLPSLATLWTHYPNGEAASVKALIGGRVNADWITNTCVIRLCYALNYSGFKVKSDAGMTTVSGGDGFRYGFRVREFKGYMKNHFGPAEPFAPSKHGIICFDVAVWSDATGHFDLWDGQQCRHEGYFQLASAVHIWPC